MIIGRIVGWIFVLVGFGILLLDLVLSIKEGHWTLTALGHVWSRVELSSLLIVQSIPVLRDVVATLLGFWSAPALMVVGLLLLLVLVRRI